MPNFRICVYRRLSTFVLDVVLGSTHNFIIHSHSDLPPPRTDGIVVVDSPPDISISHKILLEPCTNRLDVGQNHTKEALSQERSKTELFSGQPGDNDDGGGL